MEAILRFKVKINSGIWGRINMEISEVVIKVRELWRGTCQRAHQDRKTEGKRIINCKHTIIVDEEQMNFKG